MLNHQLLPYQIVDWLSIKLMPLIVYIYIMVFGFGGNVISVVRNTRGHQQMIFHQYDFGRWISSNN